MKDLFSLSSSALPDSARIVSFRGVEAISRPYEFELFFVLIDDHDFDMADSISAKATLSIQRDDDRPPFVFHGIFSALQLIHAMQGRALYRAVLVPQLWNLTLTRYSRVFTKKAIPEIIEAILEDGGLTSSDYRLQLDGAYAIEEHVCQYQESNLDFIHRWMEREGIYYYFEQGDAGEVLVITDNRSAHEELSSKPVRYHPLAGDDVTAGECFDSFTCQHTSLPASVRLADYDYARPGLEVMGKAAVTRTGLGEINLHGARFFSPEEGKRLAQVRSEELLAREVVSFASGTALYLRSGYLFELDDHPREAMNKKYLATQVRHFGNQGASTPELRRMVRLDHEEVYRVEVTAISADTQYRPPQATLWPRIYGFENGVVDGPANSEYAQIDDQGRYLVRFRFDENKLPDGSTSTYLRMMQPHGGTTEGWHFPLRKGTEVMVAFLGGDPDRPVIAGVVPNAHRPSTVTSRNHTQNVLRTGGSNHMVIEDLEGKQHIDLFTPVASTKIHMGGPARNAFVVPAKAPNSTPTIQALDTTFYLYTGGTAGFVVDGEWWQNVGSNYLVDVSGDATIHYVGIHTLNVDADSNEFYNAHQNITVHSGRTDTVEGGGMKQDIHGGLTQTIEPGGSQTVTGGWTHRVTAEDHDHYGSWKTDVDAKWTATMGGDVRIESTGGTITIKSPTKITLDAPEVKNTAPAKWYKHTNFSVETFFSKNSLGVQKFDATAVSVGVNGAKREATGSAKAVTGFKTEYVGAAKSYAAFKLDIALTKIANTPVDLASKELKAEFGALESKVKAFLKIG